MNFVLYVSHSLQGHSQGLFTKRANIHMYHTFLFVVQFMTVFQSKLNNLTPSKDH